MKLVIDNVSKSFVNRNGQTLPVLQDINLTVNEEEFVALVGPSGCGKSTLLNIIAGLHEPTAGEVLVDGTKVEGTGVDRGVVFQQYALFPWLTVKKNVEFGLRITLEHVTEGHLVPDLLAAENVPLAVGPTLGQASKL